MIRIWMFCVFGLLCCFLCCASGLKIVKTGSSDRIILNNEIQYNGIDIFSKILELESRIEEMERQMNPTTLFCEWDMSRSRTSYWTQSFEMDNDENVLTDITRDVGGLGYHIVPTTCVIQPNTGIYKWTVLYDQNGGSTGSNEIGMIPKNIADSGNIDQRIYNYGPQYTVNNGYGTVQNQFNSDSWLRVGATTRTDGSNDLVAVVTVVYDSDLHTVGFEVNGVWTGVIYTSVSEGEWVPAVSVYGTGSKFRLLAV